MHTPHLHILATGGTIAGMAGSATRHDYRPGQIGIETYLAKVAELGLDARLTSEQIANIGSEDMSEDIWTLLHSKSVAALDDESCTGLIITHGTDTAEETAFLLDQTLPVRKPVVVVGAMRPADAVGYDGLRNFANAVRVAGDGDASRRGVLVVMGERVIAARDVRKVRTRGTDAFCGFPRDAVGLVTPSTLEWFGGPWRQDEEEPRFALPQNLPEVPILLIHAAITPDFVDRIVSAQTRGLVIAGLGEGNMPDGVRMRLARLVQDGVRGGAQNGVPVVRASRLDEGLVDREPDDDTHGFVAARALNPQKARILLQLLIAAGIDDPATIQTEFDRR